MKKQLLATILGLTLSVSAMAQNTATQLPAGSAVSESSIANTWKALQDSPLSMSFNFDTSTVRQEERDENDNYKIDGVSQLAISYLGYKLSPNDSIKLENRYSVTKQSKQDSVSEYARIVLSYKRSNILTEADHGVGLSATLEHRYLPEGKYRNSGTYGMNRISLAASKSFGKLDLLAIGYFALHNRKSDATDTQNNYYVYGLLNQSYNVSDKTYAALTEEVITNQNTANKNEMRNLDITAEVGHNFTKDLTLAASVGGSPIASRGIWQTNTEWTDQLSYALNLNVVVF